MIGLRQNHQPLCTHMTCPVPLRDRSWLWRRVEMPQGEMWKTESRTGPWQSATCLLLQQEGRNPSPTKPPGFPPAPHLPNQWLPLAGI